eukprot:scaffold84528_cov25-Tisochrysis_lutea.AAC.1
MEPKTLVAYNACSRLGKPCVAHTAHDACSRLLEDTVCLQMDMYAMSQSMGVAGMIVLSHQEQGECFYDQKKTLEMIMAY